jgi:hypothetical protein
MKKSNKPVQKLSSEWSQIQIADSISGVASDTFAKDSNTILFPQKLEGDFDGLTDYFIQYYNPKINDSMRLEAYHLECAAKDDNLHPLIRLAAQNFYDTIHTLTYGKRADLSKILLQNSQYKSDEQDWHTDSYPGMRRVGMRVSGPETEIAHVDDVKALRTYDNKSAVIDNPRTTTYGLGSVWANKPSALTITQSLFSRFDTSIDAVTHRKGAPNGKPGLIYTTNLEL